MKKKYYHYWRNALFAAFLLGLAPGKIMAQDLATIAYKNKKPAKAILQQTGRSLKDVLKEVQHLYKVDFAYQENLVSQKFLVFTPKEGQELDKVLQEILTPLGLIYQKIDETQYAIVGETKANPPVNFDFLPLLFASSYQVGARPITNAGIIKAAEINVSGVVTGETGEPLPGVTVQVKGTTVGATTDLNGGYNISVPDNATTLVFSYIGYVAQEVAIGNRTTINVSLRPDAKSLEEVVVIGYGSVKKREVTGAVTSVKPEDFNKGAVTDPMQLIQGKVAGLSVTRTNGGDPTAGLEIRLRGTTSLAGGGQTPLIVVDGIPGGRLETISPDDIESIDILKDGSAAAIYGTRGNNGVILVTTRQGKKGALQVNYSGRAYTESTLRKVEVLSADEYRTMKQKLMTTHPDVANSMIDYGHNTDWYDEITRRPVSSLHNLSLSGGAENSSYRLSLFYVDHEGILLNSAKEEYRASLNLNHKALNNKLQFTSQLGMSYYNQNPVDYNAMRQVIQRNPTEPVYNEDGELNEYIGAWQYDNPVGILTERVRDDSGTRMFGNLGVNLDVTKSLRIGVLGGLQALRSLNGYYEPSFSLPQQTANTAGTASRNAGLDFTKTLETTIDWNKQLGDHKIDLIGGYSFQEFRAEGFNASNTNFISDDIAYNNLGSGTYLNDGRAAMGSFKNESRLVGFFGRAVYNFGGKYFLSASVRREGSSKFGANNKWGTFPAISAGWDLTKEAFMGKLPQLEMLKLRAGYGVTGSQGINPYISLQRLGTSGFFFYNGQFIPGYQPVSNPNPNLKWEGNQTRVKRRSGLFHNR